MPTEMLTYHHSFSTRIFPYGESATSAPGSRGNGPGANRAFTAARQLSWRRDQQSRGQSTPQTAARGNDGSALIGKPAHHAH